MLPSHFVTLAATPDRVVYSDSYGRPPRQGHVVRFLRLCRRPVVYYPHKIQSLDSVWCGLYAILFALLADGRRTACALRFRRGGSDRSLRRNDELCAMYLRRLAPPLAPAPVM